MSLIQHVLNSWLKLTEKRFLARVTDFQILRQGFEKKARFYFHAPRGTIKRGTTLAGRPALDIARRDGKDDTRILYFHGGAFIFGSPATHAAMLARLCRHAKAQAVLPDYRKAPEHPFPAALEDAEAAWAALMEQNVDPAQVIIGGDSAGGGLALSLLHRLLETGAPLPAGVFAFSPLTDLTYSGDSIASNATAEAILPASRVHELAALYLGQNDPKDPRASPLFGQFGGAPPVFLAVGDTEILRDDTVRMQSVLRSQGVDVTVEIGRDLPHVWPLFHNTLPEARHTLKALAAWINLQLKKS